MLYRLSLLRWIFTFLKKTSTHTLWKVLIKSGLTPMLAEDL